MRSPYVVNGALWIFLVAASMAAGLYFGLPTPLAFLAGANFAAFGIFFIDKNVAGSALGRVPEVILYLALWFGMPGGLAAMTLVRHKTRKAGFQLVAMLMLLVQLVLLLVLFGPRTLSVPN